MISFQTNTGALTALQMLGGVSQDLATTQTQISTGQEVNGPQDNAALWALSEMQKADLSTYDALSDTLALGEATLSVASVGAEFVSDTLIEMKQLAILGATGGADFSKIEAQLSQKTDQINSIISSSQFNGVNLLKSDINGAGETTLSISSAQSQTGSGPASLSSIDVESLDLEGSSSFDINGRTTVTDVSSAQTAIGEIEGFLQYAVDGAARLGAAASRIGGQQEFLSKQADATKEGLSALIDTNIEEAAVKLKAFQVQQQLSYNSLSIANAAPQSLLGLY